MVDTNMIAFDGIGALDITCASFLASRNEGSPVEITTSKTVTVADAGKAIHGKAVKVGKDGATTVRIRGYVEFPYTSTAPKVGFEKLVSDGTGVKVDSTNGHEYLVVSVDTVNKIVGLFL